MEKINISTHKKEELIDITQSVLDRVNVNGIKDGICVVQTQHTTAGITINENADPDVKSDILMGLSIFDHNEYQHSEGNSPAHIKASLVGSSVMIIVKDSKLQLGTWQGICFCEFDGPRNRTVLVESIGKKL